MQIQEKNLATKDPYLFEKKEIDGVPIYYNHLPWAPCVHIKIGFNIGALNDPEGKEGLMHLLEHLFYNGSPMYPTKKDVWKFRKKLTLDSLNASTSYYDTEYRAKCLPELFSEMAKGLFDLVFNTTIDPTETEREKKVVIQEIWDRMKNEKKKKYWKEFLANTRPGLLAGRMMNAAGWPETVENISVPEIKEWHKKHYHKGNIFVILVGAVSDEHVQNVSELIAKLSEGSRSFKFEKVKSVQAPLVRSKTYRAEEIGINQDHATYTIERNTDRIEEKDEVGSISGAVLWDLFFEIIRQEMGLTYGVDVSIYPLLDFNRNRISLNLPADKIDAAEKKLFELIDEVAAGKHEDKFIEEKRIAIDSLKSKERTSGKIIDSAIYQLINNGKIMLLSELIKETDSVTHSDMVNYVKETFQKDKLYIERILP
jgi:predicted Zn-dependent peptidase